MDERVPSPPGITIYVTEVAENRELDAFGNFCISIIPSRRERERKEKRKMRLFS